MERPQLYFYQIEEYFEIEMFDLKRTYEKWKVTNKMKSYNISFLNDEYHPYTCRIEFISENGKFIYAFRTIHKCAEWTPQLNWVEKCFDEEKLKQRIEEIINV